MPRTHAAPGTWIHQLRSSIKRKLGKGWDLIGQSKSTKLSRRDPDDGSCSSVMLKIEFTPENDTAIATEVQRVVSLMEEHDISLKASHQLGAGL